MYIIQGVAENPCPNLYTTLMTSINNDAGKIARQGRWLLVGRMKITTIAMGAVILTIVTVGKI